ncbi:MAG: hypothetical protein L0215_11555 [Gemmataceae bacterium]|nr:hypothetical protein [Gemmataceae bacterium]
MKYTLIAFGAVLFASAAARSQEPPSYAKQVRPFFAKYCLECHNPKSVKGGLDLETVKAMLEGGNKGDVLTPGKPDQSRLVLMMEGKAKPQMPPKEARFRPKAEEIAQVRHWIKAGAKDDSALVKAEIPDIKPRKKAVPPIRALAYVPGQAELVAAWHRELLWGVGINTAATKEVVAGLVTGLAFQPKGDLLAVALSEPGVSGTVVLQRWQGKSSPPDAIPKLHNDSILDIAFSPNGKWLATSSYDTLVKIVSLGNGRATRTLKEHSDAVYALAFSPDSQLLATCSADRAVKVWEVATGKLLYTLGEANDWLHTLAWSPDGKHLASGGVDKSIRVYRVDSTGGKILHSVFAHEAPVQKILFSVDGKTLFSLGQDGVLKAWDAERMVERHVFERLPETGLTFAVHGNEVAVGLYNGTIRLFDATTGKMQRDIVAQLLDKPAKPMPPELAKITPASGQRGSTHRLSIQGKNLDQVTEIITAGAKARLLAVRANEIDAEIAIPPTAPAGPVAVKLKGAAGESKEQSFFVDLFPLVPPAEGNDSPGTGQLVKLPASIAGKLDKAGDVDYCRFEAKAGQQLGVHLLTKSVGSKIDPFLQLVDARGRLLAESLDGVLGYIFSEAGTYAVGVRDRELRGGADMHYRLHLGEIPVVISLFPLGLERGQEGSIGVKGVFVGTDKVRIKVPADAAPGSKLKLSIDSPLGQVLGPREIVVGEFPETIAAQKPHEKAPVYEGAVPVPGTANGYLHQPGQRDVWKFRAKKGERLILEVNARRLGSGLDSILEVLDEKNQPVPRAVLRCQAKTYVTFRDHDSAPNIRIETWSELGVNDYLFVGGELMRIKELPTHPDADCFFFSAGGQRQGFLDTTPVHHSMNEPMYKVTMHPSGSKFPPNGYPVFTLFFQNDDGGPGYGRDSRIFFDAPADGDYRVRISDSRGQSGDNFGYRLTIRPPRPSFNISLSPTKPALSKGGAIPITVNVERFDGYDGPIAVEAANLPLGLHAPTTFVEAGQNSTAFALYADDKADGKMQPLKLIASALIDGKKQLKEAQVEAPKVMESGEIVCWTEQSEVTLKPGGQTKLTVHIERRQGFLGRVPLEVKGLPHGVRVLDLGLNGILINENEVRRTIVIYAEPWVDVPPHPCVVLAKREGKNTEHAAKSVLLKIAR